MHKFQTGDIVRIISDCNNHLIPIGEIVTLGRLQFDDFFYDDKGGSFYVNYYVGPTYSRQRIVRECDLELAKSLDCNDGE